MSNKQIALILILTISFFSCKKKNDDSLLGLDVQPENDLIGVTITDTASLFMNTVKVNQVTTYNDQYKYLGSTLDPVFGRTDASIYTNFSIANNLTNVSFGVNPILDSAEIVIKWLYDLTGADVIGNTNTDLLYDVYLLNEPVVATGLNGNYNNTNTTLAKSNATVCHVKAKYVIRNGYYCLVLPLNYNYGQYILQTEANLVNNTTFIAANKGLYITSQNTNLSSPTEGAIRRLDLDDDLSGINIYYHDGSSVSSKGQKFQFTFRGTDAARFNNINHNYTAGANPNLYDQLLGDTKKGEQNVYLNCFGGTRTRITLPYLKNFSDSQTVAINRAELIIKVDRSFEDPKYGYPSVLTLLADSMGSGREELVYDQLESTDFIKYNGTYDSTNKQYVFNIARQVEKILTNKIVNYGFYLVNANPNRSITVRRDNRLKRVVFGGTNNTAYKPLFRITYIKFPHD